MILRPSLMGPSLMIIFLTNDHLTPSLIIIFLKKKLFLAPALIIRGGPIPARLLTCPNLNKALKYVFIQELILVPDPM